MEKKGTTNGKGTDNTPRKGRQHRSNALEPELRLIDVNTKEEVDTDSLSVSRFESLSAADYHLAILPPTKIPMGLNERGYWTTIGSGVETVGTGLYKYSGAQLVGEGVWDVTKYSGRMLGANRIFSGSDSIRSGELSGDNVSSARGPSMRGTNYLTGWIPGFGSAGAQSEEAKTVATTQSMKIFVYSPYDCIVAVKRNLADRLQWLVEQTRYEEAWGLLDQHPEAAGHVQADDNKEVTSPSTPSKASSFAQSGGVASPTPARTRQQNTLADFFADSASLSSTPGKKKDKNSVAEKEKRRIGELWLQQLVNAKNWQVASEVAGKVLNTTTRWEHWGWVFIRNKKFDEISAVLPTFQISPPLPPSIFEIILGHYVSTNRAHFKELLDEWPTDLFEVSAISTAIEDQLRPEITPMDSNDWRLLEECLAKMYLADGRYQSALRCYVRLQDGDTALAMIKEHHLVNTIADDIPSLVLLRITPDQLKAGSPEELAELSSEPIKLLVEEATHGVVEPQEVVSQLEEASPPLMLFLFFYFRGLWRGEGTSQKQIPRIGLRGKVTSLQADEGKLLVEQFADLAVELFAEHERELLMEFLHTSTAYTFEKAVKVCERRQYIEELVYLLSKTGEMKKALFLIINELNDVSKAISFAKKQNDKDLWDDLLDYSMSRPRFISSLLIEVGTAIDPITLVKRIPSGLEIEGLKDGLKKMIREYDLQDSISSGATKVMASEVAVGMEELRKGRRRGIKFEVLHGRAIQSKPDSSDPTKTTSTWQKNEPGRCVGCNEPFSEDEKETLVGFACGHVYHVSHLEASPADPPTPPPEEDKSEDDDNPFSHAVGPKVTHARLLRDQVEAAGGCRMCTGRKAAVAQG
jgi:vacuolar protein sorting-associated protein 41